MGKITTKVTRVTEKQFDDGNWSYSFQTTDTGTTWLRGGKNRFKGVMEEGNRVEIETNQTRNRQGKETTYLESAVLVERAGGNQSGGTGSSFSAGTSASSETASMGSTLGTQSKIEYQSARNAAIEYLKMVIGSNAVKLPEKESARLKIMDTLLDAYTAQFYSDTQTAGASARVNEISEAKAKKAAAVPETEEETDEDE